MRTQIRHIICASVVMLMLVGCATSPNRPSAWEYKIIEGKVFGDEKRLDARLNDFIADGWQIDSPVHFGGNDWGFVLLKRHKK
jgi:hypothetical protein